MQAAIDAVVAGDLRRRIPLDGSGSAGDRQAASFNHMLDRIEAGMTNLQHGAKDIAHELRGPLAQLRGEAASLARHAADSPQADGLAALVMRADRLLDLFTSLTRLWEIEGDARRKRFGTVDVDTLVGDVVEMLEPVAGDVGDRLAVTQLVSARVLGDANLLRQMLVNLIENAIRHTPTGTMTTLSLAGSADVVVLTVQDDGPGIAREHHALAMRKFGRLNDQVEGQGLGLSLVEAIVRLHDGTLWLEDAAPGLRLVISFPRLR
ncbi:sensor histidine kinase [Sphingomonas sp. BAUL-RG-20F-R05-02]|uniref:HAMP domain-containing sensor histidine kinase n=1 Tax=Sphingomonas sp. BAUL-RG-20F-R05-02 TaxID=2914830 RepID=UPI001F55F16D|nr:HAMP domain-containing sensor histidine kinase [Sphingomonas sp. BAUL-RG-20F-R05-02]